MKGQYIGKRTEFNFPTAPHAYSTGSTSFRRNRAIQNPIPAQAIPMMPIVTESEGVSDFWYAGAIGTALGSLGIAGALVVVVVFLVVVLVEAILGAAVFVETADAFADLELTVAVFFFETSVPGSDISDANVEEVFWSAIEDFESFAEGMAVLADMGASTFREIAS